MKALIVVDIQNDFLEGGSLAVPDGRSIIPTVNQLMDEFDLVVATQDFHPANHGSFADNHEDHNLYDVIDLNGLDQVLWPVHCVQGTHGAEFASTLATAKFDAVFPKGTDPEIDSYSGFYDNGHRKSTGMGDFLKEKGVTHVYVVGLATDYCVKFTALDARAEGFTTFLIEDAAKGVNLQPDDVKDAVGEMDKSGVIVIDSALILNPERMQSA